MNDSRIENEHSVIREAPAAAAPRVHTLLLCDLVDSTALVERLGDAAAAELFRKHDHIAREALQRHRGREIDKTDGFLVLFERPLHAVGFALDYQRALNELGSGGAKPLAARVGIHVGEVVLWENASADIAAGAKPIEVEGLAKSVAARLMQLAVPGQTLLSGIAFSLAQRAASELRDAANLRWLTHGRYRFKGVAAPMLVHEVGEAGFAPLQAPPSTAKAQRDVPLWRRPGALALEAIALLAAVAIPFALSLRAAPAIAFGERDWIVMAELNNLTGETLLDDSLETAFRISLEQSRYVNVLSDLKLRDTLARMQKPADTTVDRNIASEIALREGARAVILPTVAEIGGRVRVSAEVIDPHTQTTVYAESADGVGAASTLDSIDSVTHTLREKLGETLASIEKDSAPLPQVTSANLDALRAYALGYRAYLNAEFGQAVGLYQQALALDPEFAQAHVGMGRIHIANQQLAKARPELVQALRHRDRMTAREALYAQAFLAELDQAPDILARWQALRTTYPDFFPSYFNYALQAWSRENRFIEAIRFAEGGLNQKNPALGVLYYFLGMLELGRDNLIAARENLDKAKALGTDAAGVVWVALFGASRDFEAADNAISNIKRSELPAGDILWRLSAAAVAADQGDMHTALKRLRDGREAATAVSPLLVRIFDGATLSLLELTEPAHALRAPLAAFVDTELQALKDDDPAEKPHAAYALAWASAMAARSGDLELAERSIKPLAEAVPAMNFPVVQQMLETALAQLALARNQSPSEVFLSQARNETASIATRAVAVEVLAGRGKLEEARAMATALAAARGRAYVESSSNYMLRARFVVETNLAVLRSAELGLALGEREAAQSDLAKFEALRPEAQRSNAESERLRRLRQDLEHRPE